MNYAIKLYTTANTCTAMFQVNYKELSERGKKESLLFYVSALWNKHYLKFSDNEKDIQLELVTLIHSGLLTLNYFKNSEDAMDFIYDRMNFYTHELLKWQNINAEATVQFTPSKIYNVFYENSFGIPTDSSEIIEPFSFFLNLTSVLKIVNKTIPTF